MAKGDEEWLSTADVVPIVGDGSLAGPVAEGVNIPVVILDTSNHPKVAEVIRVHAFLPPGDVRIQWGGVKGKPDDVLLVLDFVSPIQTRAVLRFSIERQGMLVEMAVTARAIYLQDGQPGDRIMHDIDRQKLLVELPDTGFRPKWDEIYISRMTAVLARRLRMSRRKAKPHARGLIDHLRSVTDFRMPRK
jgi:hypothetical protein